MEKLKIKAKKWIKTIEDRTKDFHYFEVDDKDAREISSIIKELLTQNTRLKNIIAEKEEIFGLGE